MATVNSTRPSRTPQDAAPRLQYSTRDIAKMLDASRGTLDWYVRQGLFPYPVLIRGTVRWFWAPVEQLGREEEKGGAA